MKYVVELNYVNGVPQTLIPGGMKPRGLAIHWTAGGKGRLGAINTLNYFIANTTRNASYHCLVWWEAATETFGVMWIVPPERAAHSMNPQPPTWSPLAEVRRILGDAVWDPNAASLALSFAGMPADLDAALAYPSFIQGWARLVRELSVIPSLDARPLFNHGWGQPSTRYDAGDRLIPMIYAALAGPQEEDVDFSTSVYQQPKVVRVQGTLYKQPTGDDVHWTIPEGQSIDVELLMENSGRQLCRRPGQGTSFWVPTKNILAKIDTFVLASKVEPVIKEVVKEVVVEVADPEAAQEARDALNAAIDTWLSSRPR